MKLPFISSKENYLTVYPQILDSEDVSETNKGYLKSFDNNQERRSLAHRKEELVLEIQIISRME